MTNIWLDNWISRDVIMRPYGCRVGNPPELASHLIDHTSATWDRVRPEELCLSIDIPAIVGIPLCTTDISLTVGLGTLRKVGCLL